MRKRVPSNANGAGVMEEWRHCARTDVDMKGATNGEQLDAHMAHVCRPYSPQESWYKTSTRGRYERHSKFHSEV